MDTMFLLIALVSLTGEHSVVTEPYADLAGCEAARQHLIKTMQKDGKGYTLDSAECLPAGARRRVLGKEAVGEGK